MKRGNDNSQMRPDEVEQLNDAEEEDAGTFRRASSSEMAARRIVKTKRPSLGANASTTSTVGTAFNFGAPLATTTPAFNGASTAADSVITKKANPFASLTSLTAASSAVKPSPFAGFSGLTSLNPATAADSSKPLVSFSFPTAPAVVSSAAPAFAVSKSPSVGFQSFATSAPTASSASIAKEPVAPNAASSAAAAAGGLSEQSKKIKKLNSSFAKWAGRQIEEHPLTVWKDGVQDYIKHLKMVRQKYSNDKIESDNSKAPAVTALAPTVATTATVPFKFPDTASLAPPATTATGSFKIPTFAFAGGEMTMTSPSSAISSTSLLGKDSKDKPASSFGGVFQFPAAGALGGTTTAQGTTAAPFTFNGFGAKSSSGSDGTLKPMTGFGFPVGGAGFGASSVGFGAIGSGATAVGGGGDGDDDDEGEPLLEPEKVLKNDKDTDEILHDVPCKLFGYDREEKGWKDTGKGTFRITRALGSEKQRMLMRNPIGKITLNANFYKGMKIERVKGGLRFQAVVAVEDRAAGAAASTTRTEMKMFMIKVAEANLQPTFDKLQRAVDAAS